MPARRKESHVAAPATAPAWPRSAKMPAPTIDPTPRKAAPMTVSFLEDSGVSPSDPCAASAI